MRIDGNEDKLELEIPSGRKKELRVYFDIQTSVFWNRDNDMTHSGVFNQKVQRMVYINFVTSTAECFRKRLC